MRRLSRKAPSNTALVTDGHSGVNALLDDNKKGFPDFRFQPADMHHADNAVVVEGRFTGTHDGNWRGLPATGRRVDFPLIIVFLFGEERMVCERTYFDIGTLNRPEFPGDSGVSFTVRQVV